MRFEPSGPTNDADIRNAKSIVDYVFRWMGKKFLTVDQQEEIGILSQEVRARLSAAYARARRRFPTSTRSYRRPDRALQHPRGRDRMLPLRRADGSRRHLLHLPRLRDVHGLRLTEPDRGLVQAIGMTRQGGCSACSPLPWSRNLRRVHG